MGCWEGIVGCDTRRDGMGWDLNEYWERCLEGDAVELVVDYTLVAGFWL